MSVPCGQMVIAPGSSGPKFKPQFWNFLSIACDVKLEGALYSVFYAEASKRPWTSLNEKGMYQTPSLLIIHLVRRSPTLEDAIHMYRSQDGDIYDCFDLFWNVFFLQQRVEQSNITAELMDSAIDDDVLYSSCSIGTALIF